MPLTIWHIGGDGPIGPGQAIMVKQPSTKLVTFDARPEHGMPLCFDEKEGEADFYITKNGMASGLLKSDPAMAGENCLWDEEDKKRRLENWGDITTIERVVRVRTTTVDAYAAKEGYVPDVLSIDVQGAEMRVLRGAVESMPKILCAITEVEFWPIYEGQGLFDEQLAYFRARGFRLAGIFNSQPWHQGEPMGAGFQTVAEAIWLRFVDAENMDTNQMLKLAMISAIYDRTSFASNLYKIVQRRLAATGNQL